MEKKRSVGVTVFGWGTILVAILRTLRGGVWWYNIQIGKIDSSMYLGVILASLSAALYYSVGWNILRLKPIGRKAIILLSGFTLIVGLTQFVRYNFLINLLVMPIISSLYLYFFTRPKVKEQFK